MKPDRPHYLATQLQDLLRQLQVILTREGEENWQLGVMAALGELNGSQELSEDEVLERIKRAASIYRTMNSGSGSFSDFHVWRDDYDQRVQANETLDEVRERLWETVSEIQYT